MTTRNAQLGDKNSAQAKRAPAKRKAGGRWSMEWSSSPSLCYFDGNVTHHLWVDQYLAFAKNTSATTPLWNALVRALNAARVVLPARMERG